MWIPTEEEKIGVGECKTPVFVLLLLSFFLSVCFFFHRDDWFAALIFFFYLLFLVIDFNETSLALTPSASIGTSRRLP